MPCRRSLVRLSCSRAQLDERSPTLTAWPFPSLSLLRRSRQPPLRTRPRSPDGYCRLKEAPLLARCHSLRSLRSHAPLYLLATPCERVARASSKKKKGVMFASRLPARPSRTAPCPAALLYLEPSRMTPAASSFMIFCRIRGDFMWSWSARGSDWACSRMLRMTASERGRRVSDWELTHEGGAGRGGPGSCMICCEGRKGSKKRAVSSVKTSEGRKRHSPRPRGPSSPVRASAAPSRPRAPAAGARSTFASGPQSRARASSPCRRRLPRRRPRSRACSRACQRGRATCGCTP